MDSFSSHRRCPQGQGMSQQVENDVTAVVTIQKVEGDNNLPLLQFQLAQFCRGRRITTRTHRGTLLGFRPPRDGVVGIIFLPNFTPSINFWSTKLSTVSLNKKENSSPINHCISPFSFLESC
jgi:hypothetical protein